LPTHCTRLLDVVADLQHTGALPVPESESA